MWVSIVDEVGYVFISLVNSDYSTRLTNTMLYNMKTEFYKCNPGAANGAVDAGAVKSDFLMDLANRYNDPGQWDKLSEAQRKVDQVRGQIQDNLKKMTVNHEQMIVNENELAI